MAYIRIYGVIPKELINVPAVRLELLNALRKEGREIRSELRQPVSTWNHKVKFEMKVSLTRAGNAFVNVWSNDEIFGYVNNGTGPHLMGPITPNPPRKALKIPTGRSGAKTRPGKLRAYKGYTRGPYIYRKSTKQFVHPGTKKRDFTGVIIRRIDRTGRFKLKIDDALARGIAKSSGQVEVIK